MCTCCFLLIFRDFRGPLNHRLGEIFPNPYMAQHIGSCTMCTRKEKFATLHFLTQKNYQSHRLLVGWNMCNCTLIFLFFKINTCESTKRNSYFFQFVRCWIIHCNHILIFWKSNFIRSWRCHFSKSFLLCYSNLNNFK